MRRGESEDLLNKKSGLLGLSGVSSDMREVLKAAGEEQPALLALMAYCYRVPENISVPTWLRWAGSTR